MLNEAKAHYDADRFSEAATRFIQALFAEPANWGAYAYLGMCFEKMGYLDAAIVTLQRAAIVMPRQPQVWFNLAVFLLKAKRFGEAVAALENAARLDPDNLETRQKLALQLRSMNRYEEAITHFDHVIASKADSDADKERRIVAVWVRSLCKLSLGRYRDGWPDYEQRFLLPKTVVHRLNGPEWKGEPLEGKRIVLTYEQRFGDVINFVRFIPRLKAMGAHVIVQSPPQLMRQLQHMIVDVEVIDKDAEPPPFDYYVLATSVPSVLDLDLGDIAQDEVPYLLVSESDVKPVPLRRGTWLKVGLLWAGKPDPDRSLPFHYLIPLLRHPGVSFYSFQLGQHAQDAHKTGTSWLLHDLAPEIHDFYDSSALLQQMDLFITIDTAAAHQAGALGIPVWVLLIFASDWRWGVGRDDCPWYPTMRLFRQTRRESWDEVMHLVDEAFADWVGNRPPPSIPTKG